MAKSYRELVVWQRAIELTVAIYGLTQDFPGSEIYGLTSQLRRAAVAVASNIAEGWGRGSRPDYRNFLCIARGSVLEVQTQLVIAGKLRYATPVDVSRAEDLAGEVSKMLWAMVDRLPTDRSDGRNAFRRREAVPAPE